MTESACEKCGTKTETLWEGLCDSCNEKTEQPKPEEEYPGMMHSLYSVDGERLKGIRLKPLYFRDIAFRIIGNHTDALKLRHIAVTSVTLGTFMKETDLWHVKVGNAILNINPEGVMYYFDVPVPKKQDRGPDWKSLVE